MENRDTQNTATPISGLRAKLSGDSPVILDGAMGTELLRRGIPTKLPLWSAGALFEAPEVVRDIHFDYIKAGADIITTNTFRTNIRVVEYEGSPHTSKELTAVACELALAAREKSGRKDVAVAGCLAPVEDCYMPELVPPEEELFNEHLVVGAQLKNSGVDFIFAETMNSVREAAAAAKVARRVGLPFAVSFVCDENGLLLSGESLYQATSILAEYNPLFAAVNCRPAEELGNAVKALCSAAHCPVGVYANGEGLPDNDMGWAFPEGLGIAAERYLEFARGWARSGASVIGGCCGTTPEYIKTLREGITATDMVKHSSTESNAVSHGDSPKAA